MAAMTKLLLTVAALPVLAGRVGIAVPILGVTLAGLAVETVQIFDPAHLADYVDVIADEAGIAAGVALVWLVRRAAALSRMPTRAPLSPSERPPDW